VQPNDEPFVSELWELAEHTDRVADSIQDSLISQRLRAIAEEVRQLAGHGVSQQTGDESCRSLEA
jgi:hypothetical protein